MVRAPMYGLIITNMKASGERISVMIIESSIIQKGISTKVSEKMIS